MRDAGGWKSKFYLVRMNIILNFLAIFSFLGLIGCSDVFSEKHQYAENLILKVEDFKEKEGRLPNDLSEIHLKEAEDSPAFYQKIDDNSFEVWYAIGFESKVYNSITKQWREEG